MVLGLDKGSSGRKERWLAQVALLVGPAGRFEGRRSQPSRSRKGMVSENVPRALLYFIDILIKAGTLFGDLCSEVEITLMCCPRIKLPMDESSGSSSVPWHLVIPFHYTL